MKTIKLTVLLVTALVLAGCYSDKEQYTFAKQCVAAGMLPTVNPVAMACRPIDGDR